MPNNKYDDNMIEEVFRGVHDKLDLIYNQTSKTNGHVADLKDWKSRANGFAAAMTMFVVPILMYLVYLHIG